MDGDYPSYRCDVWEGPPPRQPSNGAMHAFDDCPKVKQMMDDGMCYDAAQHDCDTTGRALLVCDALFARYPNEDQVEFLKKSCSGYPLPTPTPALV